MTHNEYPRLCGGTFFTLILQDLKQRVGAREHYKGESDGLSDPDVLIGQIEVINSDYARPHKSIKTKVNDFKSCGLSKGEYLPFGKTAEIEEFDKKVRTDYASVLADMAAFVENFLEVGTAPKKDYRLVKALMDLIKQDDSIGKSNDDEFFVTPDGQASTRCQLIQMDKGNLPSFLLGVWHFCCVHRKNNKVGENTYNLWCPANGGGPREYQADMGKDWEMEISFYDVENIGKEQDADERAEVIDHPKPEDNTYRIPGEPQLGQFLANPKTNVHYGTGDIYSDIETLTINKNYYGGKGE